MSGRPDLLDQIAERLEGALGPAVAAATTMLGRSPRLVLAAVMTSVTAVVWLGQSDPTALARAWDGPHYLIVAKTLYQIPADHPFASRLPASYYACHLPMYPLLIRTIATLLAGDYVTAMLAATLLSAVGAVLLFHQLLKEYDLVRSPLWTATLFCFLPVRFIVYHSIGATEPLFYVFVFAALLAYRRGATGWLLVWIAGASLTRITGILLVPVFVMAYALRREWRRACAVPFAGLALTGLFGLYHVWFGDFFAYLSWNQGREGLLRWPPFSVFAEMSRTYRFLAAERLLLVYAIYGLGVLLLWRQRVLFLYTGVFFVFYLFLFHQDLPRYMLSVTPFALLVAYDSILSSRPARLAAPVLCGLGLVYAVHFVPMNLVETAYHWRILSFLAR